MKPKLSLLSFISFLFIVVSAKAQITPPYYNNFDTPADTLSWSHHAISGTDDWQCGTPAKYYFNSAKSVPWSWVTKLNGNFSTNSVSVLETPFFNLSDTSKNYVISFYHKILSASASYFYLEYSSDNGNTWVLLNTNTVKKKNWQGTNGFSNYSSFTNSILNIRFIEGNNNVKFRFRMLSGSTDNEGWLIDNFSIIEESYNLTASQGDDINISKKCPNFTVKTTIGYSTLYDDNFNNTTNYYLSKDTILDAQDTLIGNYAVGFNFPNPTLSKTFTMLPNLIVGKYYILYKHDALNVLQESNENDNIAYALLKVDSIYNLPLIENFENNNPQWKAYTQYTGPTLFWEFGSGKRHHLEGAHSGLNAWHTSKTITPSQQYCPNNVCNEQSVEFPYINLSGTTGNLVLSLWYKNQINSNVCYIEYSDNCYTYWNTLCYFTPCRDDEWDFVNLPINQFSASNNLRFRVKYVDSYTKPEGIIFDDVYIGIAKPDLSIERDLSNRYSSVNQTTDTLTYYLTNSGLAAASQSSTVFYWSNDTILDASDILIGYKTEQVLTDTMRIWTNFIFTKPLLTPGKYYILYKLDTADAVDEMREYNNTGYFTLYQQSVKTLPYYNDFETQIDGWRHNASLGKDDWMWTIPHKTILDTAFSGIKAWVTNDTGSISTMSRMHLYSPVFNFTNFNNPVLEFDMKLQNHPCGCAEGNTNMSYSSDGGRSWIVLDTMNQSYNKWYYPMEYLNDAGFDRNYYTADFTGLLFAPTEKSFVSINEYNSRDVERNTRYILDLKFLQGLPKVQFRYNLATLTGNSAEGALIDNFTIREAQVDLNVKYRKSLMISSLSQNIRFFININNSGNYISKAGKIKYYLSADTIINASAYYLGMDSFPAIRPDMSYYLNESYAAPSNLSSFKYLLHETDATNTNSESNETNNINYWYLALDSIKHYPYLMDFNDTIVNGWNHYAVSYSGDPMKYRFRNMLAPADNQSYIRKSGQMFTEWISNIASTVPIWNLTTPAFDFSNLDSIYLSFDLMCVGYNVSSFTSGGNLSYSTDGGNNFTAFPYSAPIINNWFNTPSIFYLNNEPGWAGDVPSGGLDPYLDSTSRDISFLKGQKNIVFKFKFKSNQDTYNNGKAQGMRIDNFKIQAFNADYRANDNYTAINAQTNQNIVNVNYSISNIGQSQGRPTNTKFYWSNDNIFDYSDSLVKTVSESPVTMGATANLSTVINHLLSQNTTYYLFCKVDADSNILETNENNNTGSFKITTDSTTTIVVNEIQAKDISIYTDNNKILININKLLSDYPLKLVISNSLGQTFYNSGLLLKVGNNMINLPTDYKHGVYIISLYDKNKVIIRKKIIL